MQLSHYLGIDLCVARDGNNLKLVKHGHGRDKFVCDFAISIIPMH
jgi:hypothetical protein